MRSVSKNPSPTKFRLARLSSFHGRPGKLTRPLFPPPESNRVATGLTLRTPGSLAISARTRSTYGPRRSTGYPAREGLTDA